LFTPLKKIRFFLTLSIKKPLFGVAFFFFGTVFAMMQIEIQKEKENGASNNLSNDNENRPCTAER
jgi:hypothetical protein